MEIMVVKKFQNCSTEIDRNYRSLGWEVALEKGKATCSSIWPGEFHGLHSPWGRKDSDMTE